MRDVALEFQQRQEQQERQQGQGQGQPPGQGAEAEGFSSSLSSSEVSSVSSVAAEMLLSCVVADAASTLSQGQKQLLCVARILLGTLSAPSLSPLPLLLVLRKASVCVSRRSLFVSGPRLRAADVLSAEESSASSDHSAGCESSLRQRGHPQPLLSGPGARPRQTLQIRRHLLPLRERDATALRVRRGHRERAS
jgi:hypothetical protein